MPNWLHNTIYWAVVSVVCLIIAAIPFALVLWAGSGWAIIMTIVLLAFFGWLDTTADLYGVVALPAWAALIVGLVVGHLWKLSVLIQAALS